MEKKLLDSLGYVGKLGADNLLLAILGIEHLILFYLKMSDGGAHYKRYWLSLYEAIFFLGYAIFNDIYRFKALRGIILTYSNNFLYINSTAILLFGIPLLIRISIDIQSLIIARSKTKYVKKDKERRRHDD